MPLGSGAVRVWSDGGHDDSVSVRALPLRPSFELPSVIGQAQAAGWDVCLGLTPTAARWLEPCLLALEELTGHPVRSEYKLPGEPDVWPPAT